MSDGARCHYCRRMPCECPEEPQPAPTPNDQPHITDLAIELLRERDALGRERYGTSLQPFNGRDFGRDADEEMADWFQYWIGYRIEQRRKIDALKAELEQAKANNSRCACSYCGQISQHNGTAEDFRRVVWEHIQVCQKSPYKRLEKAIHAIFAVAAFARQLVRVHDAGAKYIAELEANLTSEGQARESAARERDAAEKHNEILRQADAERSAKVEALISERDAALERAIEVARKWEYGQSECLERRLRSVLSAAPKQETPQPSTNYRRF